jgi:hypothetical protein
MARASYIYILRAAPAGSVVAAFTVKYESQEWAERRGGTEHYVRTRIADGVYSDKTEHPCPWEE